MSKNLPTTPDPTKSISFFGAENLAISRNVLSSTTLTSLSRTMGDVILGWPWPEPLLQTTKLATAIGTAQLDEPSKPERSHSYITAFATIMNPHPTVIVKARGTHHKISTSTEMTSSPIAKRSAALLCLSITAVHLGSNVSRAG